VCCGISHTVVLCVLGAQNEGVGAKIAYCRQESGVADLLHPGAVLANVDGASVGRVPTGEVRVRLRLHAHQCSGMPCSLEGQPVRCRRRKTHVSVNQTMVNPMA
jgi:hypothetical protein